MIQQILSFFTCGFNVFGMLLFMSDTDKVTDILKRMSIKAKIYAGLTVLLISRLVCCFDIYLVLFLAMEYLLILWWYRKQKKEHFSAALKGILNIVVVLLAEIATTTIYAHKEILNAAKEDEIRIICYLSMAMIQYLLIISWQIKKMRKDFRKTLMITLEIKAIEDTLWLYIFIGSSLFAYDYLFISGLFILSILINYIVFFILILKIEEKSKQLEWSDIHINAYEYYLNMEEEHLLIRKMYHDMKNQLMIFKEEQGENSEMTKVLAQSMSEKLDDINRFYHTGMPSLDILLFDGRLRAQEKGIEFEAMVSEGCLEFMDEKDASVIFSNAIINAIEACEKIAEGPKQIQIKAGKNVNDTLIYIKNTVSRQRKKGNLYTNKKNSKMHGIGLSSIQECVEKYKGYVSIIEEDDTFQLAILFGKE